MNFSFLDYIWRGLTIGTLTSLIILAALFLTFLIINKIATRQQMKYFFHSQILLMLVVFAVSFTWVALFDPDLASGCFNAFAKDKSFFTLTRLFAAVWLGGSASLIAWDLFRIFRSSVQVSHLTDSRVQGIFSELKAKFNIKSEVQILVSEEVSSPHAEGLAQQRVVIPSTLLEMPTTNMQHILAHELVHVRDRDSVWKGIELLTRRVLFFNPLMYVLAHRHLLAIEKAADEEAVTKLGAEAKDYINTLIEVVSLHRWTGQSPLALNASRTFLETKERMESLVVLRKPKKKFVNILISSSILVSLGFSVAQARSSVSEATAKNLERGLMCQQVHHEKVIESWLRIEPKTNKCE